MVAFAVAVTLAMPDEFVVAVVLERIALAPLAGVANVTVTPLSTFPPASFARTCNGLTKLVDTAVACGVLEGVSVLVPPRTLLRTNDALTEPEVAVMV